MAITLPQTSFTKLALTDRILGDVGLRGSNLVTAADVYRWAEDILRRAAQESRWYRVTDATVDVVANQAEYNLPTGCIALEFVYHDQLPLYPIRFDELVRREPYWQITAAGTPICWYRRGMTSYGLYPTPASALTDGLTLMYSGIPALPATTADVYNFPQSNEMLIEAYCRYRASLKDATGEGGKRVAVYEKEYLSEMERFKQEVAELGEPDLWVMGGDSTLTSMDPIELAIARAIVPAPV